MSSALEILPVTKLRAIAQSLGYTDFWAWDKPKLISRIREKSHQLGADIPTESSKVVTKDQEVILKALEKYKDRDLVVTFPTKGSVRMTRTIVREDTCHITTPLKTILECAKKLLND